VSPRWRATAGRFPGKLGCRALSDGCSHLDTAEPHLISIAQLTPSGDLVWLFRGELCALASLILSMLDTAAMWKAPAKLTEGQQRLAAASHHAATEQMFGSK
jgi:hypothetical protein